MKRLSRLSSLATHPPILVLSAILIAVGVAGVTVLTDSPQFCASCHEMTPYYDAWSRGPHKSNWCVDCHVEPGAVGHLAHKFVALGQLRVHLTGTPSFPMRVPPEVPAARCTACHTSLPTTTDRGFSHSRHAIKTCVECHSEGGHAVSSSALKTAGVFAEGSDLPGLVDKPAARVGGGAANLKGHIRVVCSVCHNMAETSCSKCHEARHRQGADRGSDCDRCHQPGVRFVFRHSVDAGSCDSCHAAPRNHTMPGEQQAPECSSCHTRPGISWAATHVNPSANCPTCHTAPSGVHPRERPCTLCHTQIGVSFAFRHPDLSAPHQISRIPCPKCHPNSYTRYACLCHKPTSAGQQALPQ